MLGVDETLEDDEVTEVVNEKDEEDRVESVNGEVLEDVVCTSRVEVEVGVVDVDVDEVV